LTFSSKHSYINTPGSACLSAFFFSATVILDAGVQMMLEIRLSFIVSEESMWVIGLRHYGNPACTTVSYDVNLSKK
jgi:hypothetical protein